MFAIAFYSYGIWTSALETMSVRNGANVTDISTSEGQISRMCVTIDDWLDFLKIMSVLDAILTMILPFILIFTFNLLIITKLTKKRRQSQAKLSAVTTMNQTTNNDSNICTQDARTSINSETNGNTLRIQLKRRGSLTSESSTNSDKRDQMQRTEDETATQNMCARQEEAKTETSLNGGSLKLSPQTGQNLGSFRLARKKCLINEEINISHLIDHINSNNKSFCKSIKRKRIKAFIRSNYEESRYTTRAVRLFSTVNKWNPSPRTKMYSKTTRMLLIISATFFVLHGPQALLKLWYILAPYFAVAQSGPAKHAHRIEELLERITCYTYYLHYVLNFFLYVLNLKKFRKTFLAKLKRN